MKRITIGIISLVFLVPTIASAHGLNNYQINSIIGLLQAFNVDQSILTAVQNDLLPQVTTYQYWTPQIQTQSVPNEPIMAEPIQNTEPLAGDVAPQCVSNPSLTVNGQEQPLVGSSLAFLNLTFTYSDTCAIATSTPYYWVITNYEFGTGKGTLQDWTENNNTFTFTPSIKVPVGQTYHIQVTVGSITTLAIVTP